MFPVDEDLDYESQIESDDTEEDEIIPDEGQKAKNAYGSGRL